MYHYFFATILLLSFTLHAQNSYHVPTEINNAGRWVRGDAARGATMDTRILIYQHAGAELVLSGGNTGQANTLNGAGHYDLNRVVRVVGDTLFLELPINNNYDPAHTQIVRYESAPEVIVTGEVAVSQAFDGRLGGVNFIAADDRLTLSENAVVTADRAGFRGGVGTLSNSQCNRLTVASGLTYGEGNWLGSSRGEGIGGIPDGQPLGRAQAGNGGGGGNDHNAGGGGGANVSFGGGGARNIVMGLFNNACRGNFPGRAGDGLPAGGDRLFFGGGGGAGHANNVMTAEGGRGGGLVVLWAGEIKLTEGSRIGARGADAPDIFGDGGGGGGAAGTILLLTGHLSGRPAIDLNGGQGGDVDNPPTRCFGPGGGGSGGHFVSASDTRSDFQPSVNRSPGGFGRRLGSNECGPNDEPAGTGEEGVITTIDPPIVFPGFTADKDTICGADQIRITDQSAGADQVTYSVIPADDAFAVSSIGSNGLVAYDGSVAGDFQIVQSLTLDGTVYAGDTVDIVVYPAANTDGATLTVDNEFVNVTISNPADFIIIRYDFGDGTVIETDESSIDHTYAETGNYEVSVTLTNANCGDLSVIDETVEVGEFVNADISVKSAEGCAPYELIVTDISTGTYTDRAWNFPGATPATSNEVRPRVIYETPGEYTASLTLLDAVGRDTFASIAVTVIARPVADFSFEVDTATAVFSSLSMDGGSYDWDFGDGNGSRAEDTLNTYAATGVYPVTLIVANGPCRDTITQEVRIDVLSDVRELSELGVSLYPNPTTGVLHLSGPAKIVSVFDPRGRLLTIPVNNDRVDLGVLPVGMYVVTVRVGRRTYSVKISKQR